MEIFNNIWTAVSTPNEGLATLLVAPGGFIEAFLIMKLLLSLLEIKTRKKFRIIYVACMAIIRYYCNVYNS